MAERKKRGIAVGLTGNIGSGKTTVLTLFGKFGCRTLSTDTIAHDLLDYNPAVKKRIIGTFGGGTITDKNGRIDRQKLANVVFDNDAKRKQLEDILHPEVKRIADEEIKKVPEGSIMVVEAPLLFESGWHKNVDYHVMISCPTEIRKKRFYMNPAHKPGDFERRDKVQWAEDKKEDLVTFRIDNSGDLTRTISEVTHVLKMLRQKVPGT